MTNLNSILKSRDITLPTKVYLIKTMVFPIVMYGCENWTIKKLSTEELMPLNCGVGEDAWEFLGLQGDPTCPSKRNQPSIFIRRTDAETETPILWPSDVKNWLFWKDPDAGKAGGEGHNRGWDGWMALPTPWTWVWINSSSWWRTEKPGALQFMGLQRVGHDWATELNCLAPFL